MTNPPRFVAISGGMSSSKTTTLIKHLMKWCSDGKKCLIIKHCADARFGESKEMDLSTHSRIRVRIQGRDAQHFASLCDVPDSLIAEHDAVFLDELQFFGTKTKEACDLEFNVLKRWYTDLRVSVYAAGLNMWHDNSTVDIMARAVAISDEHVQKFSTCVVCERRNGVCSPRLPDNTDHIDPEVMNRIRRRIRESAADVVFDGVPEGDDDSVVHRSDSLVRPGNLTSYTATCLLCYNKVVPPESVLEK